MATAPADITAPRVFPTMRYSDAPAMIDWLCRAFGFERHAVYEASDGSIVHAELACGNALIMLGSAKQDEFGALVGTPADFGGTTQAVYIAVDDIDAHCQRATAAGAVVVMPLRDTSYGSRDYICHDPEGQVWCFGTYWPRVGAPAG